MAAFPSPNPFFLHSSCFDGNAVSALNTMDGYPATNLTNSMIRRVYKSDLVSYSGTINGPLGSTVIYLENSQALPINSIALLNHNLTVDDTVSLIAWTIFPAWSSFWTIDANSSGVVNPCPIYYFGSNTVNYQYWQIWISPATERRVQIGRVFAGMGVQLTNGIKDGYSIEEINQSVGSAENGRQGYWSAKTTYHRITIDPGQLSEVEYNRILAIYNTVGMHEPFVFTLDPHDSADKNAPTQHSYYVQFATPMQRQHVVNRQHTTGLITLEEKV